MTIDNDVKITINLTDLVNIRADALDLDYEDLDTCDRENITNELRTTLTWDTLYYMIDNALLDYIGQSQNHYGEIAPEPGREAWLNEIEKNKKQFEMVDLVSPSWTIQVPRRKK
tara:strand:- start:138 stop:479 length:342 start_codon:yes stop_codon:yes gene_type:complete